MKKILSFIFSCLLLVLMTACDNNEGPFDLRKENGVLVLYSNNKPAKGWVEETQTNFDTMVTTKLSEIEYNKGLPTGKFKYYDNNGVMIWDANLKEKGGLFEGTINFSVTLNNLFRGKESVNGEMKGTFAINPNWIVGEHGSLDPRSFFEKTAVDATYNTKDIKGSYKNRNKEGEWIFEYSDAIEKVNYIKGEKNGKYEALYQNGTHIEGNYSNGKKNGEWIIIADYNYLKDQISASNIFRNFNLYRDDYDSGTFPRASLFKIRAKFIDDKREGTWEYFDNENNTLVLKENYKNNILNGYYESYDSKGNILEEGNIINYENHSRTNGVWKFYVDENILVEGEFKNGNPINLWKEYYKNGKIKFEVNYNDGIWKYYDENSNLLNEFYIDLTFSGWINQQFNEVGINGENINILKAFSYYLEPGALNNKDWFGVKK